MSVVHVIWRSIELSEREVSSWAVKTEKPLFGHGPPRDTKPCTARPTRETGSDYKERVELTLGSSTG